MEESRHDVLLAFFENRTEVAEASRCLVYGLWFTEWHNIFVRLK
jgi:hypothetical protein